MIHQLNSNAAEPQRQRHVVHPPDSSRVFPQERQRALS
jgi:hypothetical protein